jgi:hypothetical protein
MQNAIKINPLKYNLSSYLDQNLFKINYYSYYIITTSAKNNRFYLSKIRFIYTNKKCSRIKNLPAIEQNYRLKKVIVL